MRSFPSPSATRQMSTFLPQPSNSKAAITATRISKGRSRRQSSAKHATAMQDTKAKSKKQERSEIHRSKAQPRAQLYNFVNTINRFLSLPISKRHYSYKILNSRAFRTYIYLSHSRAVQRYIPNISIKRQTPAHGSHAARLY